MTLLDPNIRIRDPDPEAIKLAKIYIFFFTFIVITKHDSEAGSYLFSTVICKDILLFCSAEYEVFLRRGLQGDVVYLS